jgi:flagellar basal body P-ring protein FlgI
MKPFWVLIVCGLALPLAASAPGCAGPDVRSQSPEEIEKAGAESRVVGDYAVPHQMNALVVEAVGLVSVPNTGSDPPPSPQRIHLIDEMLTRGVDNPDRLLASGNFAMVLVRGYLRPGVQKGDRFDVEVRVPAQDETVSLRGGWLMETQLKQLAVLGNEIREGKVEGLAQGPLLVDPATGTEADRIRDNRARILGGGVSLISRPLALVVKPQYKSVRYSSQVAAAINRRFHTFADGNKTGVAKARDDQYVELLTHPRYKDNIERYMRVVRAVALRESERQRIARIALIERQLLDPVTSSIAALKLEALGRDAVPALLKGIESDDGEVRFYAAEALAYLDDPAAALPLANAARDEPAFRVFALAALSAMDNVAAVDRLRELLDSSSAETRYGAFRALWAMNAQDPLVRGESFDGKFSYHVLPTAGPPMVHATRSFRPEIVLFGPDQRLIPPLILDAGPQIHVMAHNEGDAEVVVSRIAVGDPVQKRTVSTKIDDIIRAIVELGGTYPDIVQALQQANQQHALPSRFEVDAVPEAGRTYRRDPAGEGDDGLETTEDDHQPSGQVIENPVPDLFSRRTAEPGLSVPDSDEADALSEEPPAEDSPAEADASSAGIPDASEVFDSAEPPGVDAPEEREVEDAENGENEADAASDRPRPLRAFFARMSGGGDGD